MKRYKEINLEEGMPYVRDALDLLKETVRNCKSGQVGCLLVIHGYGSTGKGGAIKKEARRWLNAQVRNGKIKQVIYGEDFTLTNFEALKLKGRYPDLQEVLEKYNHGITVAEI